MSAYKGSIDLIGGLQQKNGGTFPLMDASAVQVDDDGTRLDVSLTNIKSDMNTGFDNVKTEMNTSINNIKTNMINMLYVDENGNLCTREEI